MQWQRDDLNRLTNEQISNALNGENGTIGYGLTDVGYRASRTSTVPSLGNQSYTYNANGEIAAPATTYDANGNPLQSTATILPSPFGGDESGVATPTNIAVTDVYDFENRLIRRTRADDGKRPINLHRKRLAIRI